MIFSQLLAEQRRAGAPLPSQPFTTGACAQDKQPSKLTIPCTLAPVSRSSKGEKGRMLRMEGPSLRMSDPQSSEPPCPFELSGSIEARTIAMMPVRTASGNAAQPETTTANSGSVGIAGVVRPRSPPMLPDLLPPESETGVFPAEFNDCSSPGVPIQFVSLSHAKKRQGRRSTHPQHISTTRPVRYVRLNSGCCLPQTWRFAAILHRSPHYLLGFPTRLAADLSNASSILWLIQFDRKFTSGKRLRRLGRSFAALRHSQRCWHWRIRRCRDLPTPARLKECHVRDSGFLQKRSGFRAVR